MFKNLLQVYSLLVCLFASIMIMITSGMALNSLADFTMTEIKHYGTLLDYDDNEAYLAREWNEQKLKELKKLPEADLTAKRLKDRVTKVRDLKHYAVQHMIDTVPWLLVSLIFFMIHWRLYHRQKKTID